MKKLSILLAVMAGLAAAGAEAAPRESNAGAKMAAKLQAMVKSATAERDAAVAEKDKLAAEVEQLKKDKSAAASVEKRLSGELAAQKSSHAETRSRLDQTHAKLLEVIDKYKALSQEKTDMAASLAELQNVQAKTDAELQNCEVKNVKMFEAAKEVLGSYENQGIMDALFKAEPVLGIKSVEMESLMQEYDDKLRKQQFRRGEVARVQDTVPETGNGQEDAGKAN